MSATAVRLVVSRLHPGGSPTDAHLVLALAPSGNVAGGGSREPAGGSPDEREEAFAELVGRYGPMVLGVCRGVLADAHAAEDAFQAVFLVLARKAESIRPPGSVGGWLYGVAVRTARKAKTTAARRQRHEMRATSLADLGPKADGAADELDRSELRAIIDTELAALPEMHRAAVVLCDLQGKTRAEVAAELGRAEGTVGSWLARGRKALASRLARRGLALPAAGLVAVVTPSLVSAELSSNAAGIFAGCGVPASALALAESVLRSLSASSTKLVTGICAVGALLAAVATAPAWHTNPEAPPDTPATQPRSETAAPLPSKPEPDTKGFLEHSGFVYSVSYSLNGKQFLSVGGGQAVVWDSVSGKKLFAIEGAEFARFSGDGKSFFYLTRDEFCIADPATGKSREKAPRGKPKPVFGFDKLWATISGDGSARVESDGVRQNVTSYPVKGELPTLADQRNHNLASSTIILNDYGRYGAFAPGGAKRFAGIHAATADAKEKGCLTIWELPEGRRTGTISHLKQSAQAFAWSPDGTEIAVAFPEGARSYLTAPEPLAGIDGKDDTGPLKLRRKFDAPGGTAVAWSKDGKLLAVAVLDGVTASTDDGMGAASTKEVARAAAVLVFDPATGKQIRRFEGFPDNLPVVALAFSPDGKQLLCGAGFVPGGEPGKDDLKPAKGAKGLRVLNLDEEPKKPALKWKQQSEIELAGWLGGSVAYSPDGKVLFVGGTGGNVQASDAATRKKIWGYKGNGTFAALGLAPDGKTLAVTDKDGVQFLDPATGKPGDALEEKDSDPVAVAWFPDAVVKATEPPPTSRKVLFGSARGYFMKTWLAWPKVSTITTSTVAKGKKPPDEYAVPLAVASDGRGAIVTGPLDPKAGKNVLWMWSAGSGAANELLEGHRAAVVSAAWSKDDTVFATGDADGLVLVWDAAAYKVKGRVNLGGRVASLAISADGKTLAAAAVPLAPAYGEGAYTEEVFVWPTAERRPKPEPISRHEARGVFNGFAAVAFSPDGATLAATFANTPTKPVSPTGRVRLFRVEEPKPQPGAKSILDVRFSPDGKRFAAVTPSAVGVYDTAPQKLLWTVGGDAAGFTANGKALLVASDNMLVCDAETGKILKQYARPKGRVVVAPDSRTFAVLDGDEPRLFDSAFGAELDKDKLPLEQMARAGIVLDFAYSANGTKLVALEVLVGLQPLGADALVWDTKTRRLVRSIMGAAGDRARGAVLAPNGDELALVFKNRVEVWVVGGEAKKNPVRTFRFEGELTKAAYSPDGKQLAVGVRVPSYDRWWADVRPAYKGEVRVLDAATGTELRKFGRFARNSVLVGEKAWNDLAVLQPNELRGATGVWLDPLVTALAFAPDGKSLLAGTGFPALDGISHGINAAGDVKLFDLTAPERPEGAAEQEWTEATALTDQKGFVNGVAVSPDGKLLAATSDTGMIVVWDARTRKVLASVNRSVKEANGVSFAPDSKSLAVGSSTGVLGYELPDMKLAAWSEGHVKFGRVDTVAFSPDGTRVAATDGYVTRVRSLEGKELASFGSPPKGAAAYRTTGLAWSPDGKLLAIPAPSRDPDVWQIGLSEKGEAAPKRTLTGPLKVIAYVAWSRDGKLLVAGDEKGTVVAWNLETDEEVWRARYGVLLGGNVHALALSPDGSTLAVSVHLAERKSPSRIILLGAKDGKEIRHLIGDGTSPITALAWASDSKFLVTGSGAPPGVPRPADGKGGGEVVVWERKP